LQTPSIASKHVHSQKEQKLRKLIKDDEGTCLGGDCLVTLLGKIGLLASL
jgi:hypothetical protein